MLRKNWDALGAYAAQDRPRSIDLLGFASQLMFTTALLNYSSVLEGGRDEVCELFNAIVRDQRHTHVRLLAYDEIRERKFSNWTMGHVDLSRINPGLLLKYHEKAVLNPFACSSDATMALLDELVASASIISR